MFSTVQEKLSPLCKLYGLMACNGRLLAHHVLLAQELLQVEQQLPPVLHNAPLLLQ